MTNSPEDRDDAFAADEAATGLPSLPTWPRVYAFVLGTFVLWVVLLSVLSRAWL